MRGNFVDAHIALEKAYTQIQGNGQESLSLIHIFLETCREPVEMLVELTREFIRMYGEKKREKNILDFTDMEHFALEILIQKVHAAEENGENDGDWTGEKKYIYHMSPAARELSMKYDEVMVDEYQDSNLVQEMITNCASICPAGNTVGNHFLYQITVLVLIHHDLVIFQGKFTCCRTHVINVLALSSPITCLLYTSHTSCFESIPFASRHT